MARPEAPAVAAGAECDSVERFMKWAVVKAGEAYELRAEPLSNLTQRVRRCLGLGG